MRPFFCQVEAAETTIWLTEVAPQSTRGKRLLDHLAAVNKDPNPELMRLALKLATGAGKTTVDGHADRVADSQCGAPRYSRRALFSGRSRIDGRSAPPGAQTRRSSCVRVAPHGHRSRRQGRSAPELTAGEAPRAHLRPAQNVPAETPAYYRKYYENTVV
jgi:hypothetical protein